LVISAFRVSMFICSPLLVSSLYTYSFHVCNNFLSLVYDFVLCVPSREKVAYLGS
jgi:hypothetical protein